IASRYRRSMLHAVFAVDTVKLRRHNHAVIDGAAVDLPAGDHIVLVDAETLRSLRGTGAGAGRDEFRDGSILRAHEAMEDVGGIDIPSRRVPRFVDVDGLGALLASLSRVGCIEWRNRASGIAHVTMKHIVGIDVIAGDPAHPVHTFPIRSLIRAGARAGR